MQAAFGDTLLARRANPAEPRGHIKPNELSLTVGGCNEQQIVEPAFVLDEPLRCVLVARKPLANPPALERHAVRARTRSWKEHRLVR